MQEPLTNAVAGGPTGPTRPGHHQGDMKVAQGPVTPLLSLKEVSSPLSSWLQGNQPCGDKTPLKPREQHSTEEL